MKLGTVLFGGIALALGLGGGFSARASVPSGPGFDSFPVHEIYIGSSAPLNLTDELQKKYSETLSIEAKGPANFSGHYKLVNIDCGDGSHRMAIVDLKNGSVFMPPFVIAGINSWALRDRNVIDFRRDSQLLIIHGTLGGSVRGPHSGTHYFRWNGSKLELLSSLARNQPNS